MLIIGSLEFAFWSISFYYATAQNASPLSLIEFYLLVNALTMVVGIVSLAKGSHFIDKQITN
jgi:hypothetical protein